MKKTHLNQILAAAQKVLKTEEFAADDLVVQTIKLYLIQQKIFLTGKKISNQTIAKQKSRKAKKLSKKGLDSISTHHLSDILMWLLKDYLKNKFSIMYYVEDVFKKILLDLPAEYQASFKKIIPDFAGKSNGTLSTESSFNRKLTLAKKFWTEMGYDWIQIFKEKKDVNKSRYKKGKYQWRFELVDDLTMQLFLIFSEINELADLDGILVKKPHDDVLQLVHRFRFSEKTVLRKETRKVIRIRPLDDAINDALQIRPKKTRSNLNSNQ